MVKKWLVILLVSAYAVIISGVEVTMHYCCGKLENVSFWSDAGNECCGEENGDSCCVGKSCCETTQITASQRTPHTFTNFAITTQQIGDLPNVVHFVTLEQKDLNEASIQRASGLDPPIKRPRFLLFSSLVFYA